jgi:hypothetical protein
MLSNRCLLNYTTSHKRILIFNKFPPSNTTTFNFLKSISILIALDVSLVFYGHHLKSILQLIPLQEPVSLEYIFKLLFLYFFFVHFYSCCSHLEDKVSVKGSFHFSFLILGSQQDTLDRGSACRKAASYTQNRTNLG